MPRHVRRSALYKSNEGLTLIRQIGLGEGRIGMHDERVAARATRVQGLLGVVAGRDGVALL